MKTKIFTTLATCMLPGLAMAICGSIPEKIDNQTIYAEVISRSHMDLELVIVGKQDAYRSKLIKVTGGVGYSPEELPACDAEQEVQLNWSGSIATHQTGSFSSFISSYKICQYNVRTELVAEYEVCNWETGD